LEQDLLLAEGISQSVQAAIEPLLRFDQEPLFSTALIVGFSQLFLKSGFSLLTR